MTRDKTALIAALNDLCRESMGGANDMVVRTPGIAALPQQDQWSICQRVAFFNVFSEDNDPHGERDFGAFRHGGEKSCGRSITANPTLTVGSRDPSDTKITKRVLTIMLAPEY